MSKQNTRDKLKIHLSNLKKTNYTKHKNKQKPLFKNFDIPFDSTQDDFLLKIENLLDGKHYTTKAKEIESHRGSKSINSIVCPLCKQDVYVNVHWFCYICENDAHDKSIFDIQKAFLKENNQDGEEMV